MLFTWSRGCGCVAHVTAAQRFDGSNDSAHPASAPWRVFAVPAPDRSYSNWHWGRTWSSASVEISRTIQRKKCFCIYKGKKTLWGQTQAVNLSSITGVCADILNICSRFIVKLWRVDVLLTDWHTVILCMCVSQFQAKSLGQWVKKHPIVANLKTVPLHFADSLPLDFKERSQ